MVDYNMGARIELVDRQIYAGSQMQAESFDRSEKEKFLLSDNENIPEMAIEDNQTQHDVKMEERPDYDELVKVAEQKHLKLT